jgi:hypothetical protein
MTLLNRAGKIYIGSAAASAVYAGTTKVWDAFRPTDIAGCVVWLDASQLNLADGAAVTAWPNRGSGPQPVIQGTPVFRERGQNGMPVVRITSGQGRVRFTGTGVDKDWTLVYVGRKWDNSQGRVVTAAGSAANILVGFHGGESEQCYVEGWLTSGSSPTGTLQWRLYSADSTSTAPARFFSNGVLLASGTVTPSAGWGGTLNISGYQSTADPAVNQECSCEIAELVMYNRKLSDAERASIEANMRWRWAAPTLFKPSDLGVNLVAWFDALDASSVQIAGSGVSNWVNKGVGALTLTQSNDAWRPTYANQTVTIGNPQALVATNSPTGFDVVWIGKPRPAAGNDWRTLLRSSTGNSPADSHQVIIEAGSARLGTYYAGFNPAVVSRVSPNNMTSDTAPAPYVTSQKDTLGGDPAYFAYKAFDGITTNYAHSAGPVAGNPYWIQIDLGSPRLVTGYSYRARNESPDGVIPYQQWKSWTLAGSNDSTTWTLAGTVTNVPNFALGEKRTYPCDVPATFRYWRWTITDATGYGASPAYACAAELELSESLTWDSVWGIGYGRFGTGGPTMLSRDGGALISTGVTLTTATVPFVSFGAYQGPPPSQGFGDLKEVVFIPYNLDGARQFIEGYFAHRHSLTGLLPASHPYKSRPP